MERKGSKVQNFWWNEEEHGMSRLCVRICEEARMDVCIFLFRLSVSLEMQCCMRFDWFLGRQNIIKLTRMVFFFLIFLTFYM